MSFIADKIVMDGLTYDDVLLIPAYSEVLPRTVDLSTCLLYTSDDGPHHFPWYTS